MCLINLIRYDDKNNALLHYQFTVQIMVPEMFLLLTIPMVEIHIVVNRLLN